MRGKSWVLLLSILIVAAVAVLASSLHDVHFQPGRALFIEQPTESAPHIPIAETISQTPLWKILLFWLAFVINLVLFFYLLPPAMRKKIIRQMLSLALGSLAVLLALRYSLIKLPEFKTDPVTHTNTAPSITGANGPLPAFQPPHMAPGWIFLISFAVLAVLLLGLWLVYRWWVGPGGLRFSERDAIGAIAQSSLNDIASGQDWSDVIIQSYVRMSETVSLHRGLQRGRAATPREFAERLEQAGLPAHAVARLTRLFESARYGAKSASQSDVSEAVACLNSILQACGQSQ